MSDSKKPVYIFGQFRLDVNKGLLFERDEIVALTPKSFDTLLVLVENRGSVLSKEELMRLVWPDQFVEENNLAQNIHLIRKSLHDGTGGVKFIETIPKRGYRFVAQVEALERGNVDDDNPLQGRSRPAFIMPKTQYATGPDKVNIAYQVVGDGPFDLVFVMGWVSHLEYFWKEPSFARFLARLASFSRLILFDKRGTGLSDRVPLEQLPTLEQRMDDVRAVMEATGCDRAVLCGVSEGGPMCSLFSATYPEKTIALVMIGSYARRLKGEGYLWGPTEAEQELFFDEIRKRWGGPVGLEARAPSVANDPAFRDWWAAYLRRGASPGAALALTKMNTEIDIRHVLPTIRVPTLVIHRTGDLVFNVEEGRYLAEIVPGALFAELPGVDHLPFVGDQDAIIDAIEEFLTGMRRAEMVDRVLATVLVARVVGPAAKFTDAQWRDLLERHQAFVRKEVEL